MILKDVNNQTVAGTVCLEALVVDCNSINVEGAIIRNSLLLMNVNNSEISANAGQVRLTNCRNVLLKVEAITGIFLQNSKDIRISIGSKGIPKVYDFNSPINSENYVLIPQEPVL
ncbi:hypothetical protein PAEPH01_0218 [Pancytospora epiphaga]|nr:hypothetical protein PAEPH01_0218 [Pancytospora epiphaga]